MWTDSLAQPVAQRRGQLLPVVLRVEAPIPGEHVQALDLQDQGESEKALAAFELCSKLEGIIPALEPAHALAKVLELAPEKPKDHLMVMNMCGRGDKDIFAVAEHLGSRI